MKTKNSPNAPAAKPDLEASMTGSNAASMFQRLLVPVDFSANSQRALNCALSLADADSAEIHLVSVVESAPLFSGIAQMPIVMSDETVKQQYEQELAAFAEGHASKKATISTEVRIGGPAHEIAKSAVENKANLVIISTHGRTGLEHILLGSVAERVVREAACPVLVLRQSKSEMAAVRQERAKPFRKLLVPTDFSPRSGEALRYAEAFAKHFGGQITLLHCLNTAATSATMAYASYDLDLLAKVCAEAADRSLANQAREVPGSVEIDCVALDGPPLSEIPKFAKEGAFDLVICATHGYTGLTHSLLGSTAEGIVRHAPCPVLVYGKRIAKRKAQNASHLGDYESLRGQMLLQR